MPLSSILLPMMFSFSSELLTSSALASDMLQQAKSDADKWPFSEEQYRHLVHSF